MEEKLEELETFKQPLFTSNITAHVMRFIPGQDLYQELINYLRANNIQAAFIITCVGSLSETHIRTAKGKEFLKIKDPVEIVSLVGCISVERCHVHISISDVDGKTIGRHLMEEGNIVRTTAEVVLGELPSIKFSEEHCHMSGWPELKLTTNK
jgi:predicted DNA-binding protein with PD1-like motif